MIWNVISTSNWRSRKRLDPNEKLELEWGEYHARGVHKKNSRRYAGPKKEICDSDVTVIGIMSYRLSLKPLFVWQSSSQNQISPWIGAKGIHTRWNYKQGNGSVSHCLHQVGLELTWEPQPMPAHFTFHQSDEAPHSERLHNHLHQVGLDQSVLVVWLSSTSWSLVRLNSLETRIGSRASGTGHGLLKIRYLLSVWRRWWL